MQSEDNHTNNLKKLRKEKGLSLAEVSYSLKLTTDVISKLEESEFTKLGAYTYVRGYMNHYAQLLGVDAHYYIDLIPKEDFIVPLVNTQSSAPANFRFKRQSKNMFNYAIGTFIVTVVSFSGWYLLNNFSQSNRNQSDVVQVNELQILPQKQINGDPLPTGNEPKDTHTDNESFHYSSLIPSNTESQDKIEASVDEDSISIPVKQPIDDSNDASNIESDGTIAATNAIYQIIIQTNETSWVKVERADGSKLHNDLMQPGSMTLESNQSLHFRIGNESKVQVTINGESIDLGQYSRKNIADFKWPIEG